MIGQDLLDLRLKIGFIGEHIIAVSVFIYMYHNVKCHC